MIAVIATLVFFAAPIAAQFDHSVTVPQLNVTLSYSIDNAGGLVNFQLNHTGLLAWVGFALSNFYDPHLKNYGMAMGDFYVSFWSPSFSVTDKTNPQQPETMPLDDTAAGTGCQNNILNAAGSRTGTVSLAKWSRKIDTGDLQCDYPITVTGIQHVLFAVGPKDSFGYHGSTRVMATLNWPTGVLTIVPGYD